MSIIGKLCNIIGLAVLFATPVFANIPGGGTNGPDVTLVNNGPTVTLSNGIVSILCTKADATINQINYTYNNGGGPTTCPMLEGGKRGGELYWTLGGLGGSSFAYTLVADPANTGGNYAEISLRSTSASNGFVEVHYLMLRGSTGFYVTVIWGHRHGDVAMGTGELRENIYLSPTFNWSSTDAGRNLQRNSGSAVPVAGAPKEVSLWTNGIAAGHYEDKYKYSASYGSTKVWGWSSVNNPAAGYTGRNIGIWYVFASNEYFNGGPLKVENTVAPMIVSIHGSHYQTGEDSNFADNEVWTHDSGPYFVYCNAVPNTLTNASQAANALFSDAIAQAAAEASAWPYYWFTNANYAPASQRGTVSGQIVINDSGNPNASASNLWVGVVQQPATTTATYDFQQWSKPYQFWVKSGANGNFTIPHVIAGTNYTLYAFGPGAEGTFMSQNQTGGNPPLLYNLPSTNFSVTVTGGVTNKLGTITWIPSRMGATVFQIGYPDRTARKFRYGDDWWVGDIGPSPTNPMPVWTKFLEYPFDFPSGPDYIVGQSRWTTDWNFCQPVVTDAAGNYNGSTSTITFNLATAPTNGATTSLYVATASDFAGPLIVSVNGDVLVSGAGGVTAAPSSLPSMGYFPSYSSSDTTVREGITAAFSDERINFPGSLLHAGPNIITLNMRKGGNAKDHAMYDYLRLELTGYVPPPPEHVVAYPGNNCNLVCWPVTPGATSYEILRSTTPGSGYVQITNGVVGPVCGSGFNNATWLDTSVANGTTYDYVVRSVNPDGVSTNSPASPGVMPSAALSTSAPTAPTGLTVSSVGHHSVTLNWTASPGADFYSVYRSTLVDNLGGASNVLRTIILNNTDTGTSYTDTAVTDGTIYRYFITATSTGGTSGNSTPAIGVPLPNPPASAPGSLRGDFVSSSIVLNWSAVPGAVGYIIRRATNSAGPFNYVQNITETTYTDPGLDTNTTYYYQVSAVNAAGVSTNASVIVAPPPPGPRLLAVPGDGQVLLAWSVSPGATNYVLQRSTTNGGPYETIANPAAISYLDTGLINGTNYYYVVSAEKASGQGPLSVQASATPFAGPPAVYWTNTITTSPQAWNDNGNWSGGAAFPIGTQAVAIVNSAIAANQTINLNQAITLGSMSIGASGGAGAFNLTTNGGSLTLDNSPGFASLIQLPSSAGDTVSAPMTVNGSLFITNASANALTLSGNISGAVDGVTVAGNVTLNGENGFGGGVMANSGRLEFETATAIPASGALTLNNDAALTVTPASPLPNVIATGNNAVTGNGRSGTGISALDDEGTLTLFISGGSRVFDLTGAMTGGGTLVLGSPAMTLRFNGTAGDGSAIFDLGTGSAVADVRKTTTTAIALGGLMGEAGTQLQGDNSGGGANMTYTIGRADADTEFAGVIEDGSVGTVALVKTGSGTLTLTGANTYSAGTTISDGLLSVNNLSGSGTGSGAVTVDNGGTLGGTGIISGAVTVNSGGIFAPGNPLGTLTMNNSLDLAAGCTNLFAISRSPLTSAVANISGALTEAGTLIVTNIGGTQLAAGDTFKLFQAASYNGSFASVKLPALPFGLTWDTSSLNTAGTISVSLTTKPVIRSVAISDGSFALRGTGGVGNADYYLVGTTNLATPMTNWTRLLTNQFDNAGHFIFTNPVNLGGPQSFYLLQIP